ncbi:MAG: hypothetical protein K1X89_03185 [Myxococcaceae bacterium]|nr:hypothetical protein [Myxococcaceae bacterium]
MKTSLSFAVVAVLAAGCAFQLPEGSADAGAQPVAKTEYVAPADAGVQVNGYLWDPEAFFGALAACGQDCPIPPLVFSGIPLFEGALQRQAPVALFDPVSTAPVAAGLTSAAGTWNLAHVPARTGVPFFPFAPARASAALPDGGSTTGYLPTLTFRPVATGGWGQCLGISAVQASESGILDAVARHESTTTTTYTAKDLVDPTKFGGVAVLWAFQPGPSSLRVPAFGVNATSTGGKVLKVAWAPPGVLPPMLNQSPRGFYVADDPATASAGITVVLMPAGPPAPVTLALVDPVKDEKTGRPWQFFPLGQVVLAPGVVSYGELQGLLPSTGGGAPPRWLCLP